MVKAQTSRTVSAVAIAVAAMMGGALGLTGSASASPIAYDGFETVAASPTDSQYAAGRLIDQSPGLTGFSTNVAWTGADHSVRPINASTTDRTYTDLSTLPGSVMATRTSNSNGAKSDATRLSNTGDALPEDTPVTRWVSFLLQPDLAQVDPENANDPFKLSLTFADAGILVFTLQDDRDLVISAPKSAGAQTISALADDTTHMILTRIVHGNTHRGTDQETISVWLDPVLADGESGLGDADATLTGNVLNFNSSSWNGRDFYSAGLVFTLERHTHAQTVWFDELRVGKTSEDVGLIPEPASVALVLVGLSGLGACRRRRAA